MVDTVKLLSAIDSYAAQAHGSGADGGELSTHRALALDSYAGKNIEPAPEGRSQIVDWSIFETIQWILPSLTRIFAAGDDVVEFEPTEESDEEAAEQESQFLNYLVTQKNNWFLTCLTWFQDALLTKNAYCMAYMEEKLDVEVERYEGQSEDQVTLLMDDDVEVTAHEERQDPNDEGLLIDPATGQPIDPQDEATMTGAMAIYELQGVEPQRQFKQVYDIEIRRTKPTKRLQFKVLAPERCLVGEDTEDFTLEDANYFEYQELTTVSALRKEGHEIDDDISDDGYTETLEDAARDEYIETSLEMETSDPSMRQVQARHIWIRHDYDEDGIAELQYVLLLGRDVLKRTEVSRIPVACIVPFINTHRHMGFSVADLTFDISRIKQALMRAGLDSLNLSINPGHQVSNKVNLDDMLVSRPGRIVRLADGAVPGEGHIMPLQTEFVLPQAQAGLQYMDTVIESRVGVTRQFQGIDDSANNDYNRIGQLSTMAAQRVEQIARLFANGVERLFSLAHELIIKSGHQAEAVKLRGKWVTLDPSQWKTGRDMRVVAPFAAGNKDSLLQRLMMISTIHEKSLAGGLPIVDQKNAYNLAVEIANAADVAGYKFFTDPSTVEPPPPAPDYTMEALNIENKKADNEATDEARKSELDRYVADLDAQVKKFQVEANTQLQLALANIKAGNVVDLEKLKATLKISPIEFEGEQVAVSDAFRASADATEQMNTVLQQTVTQLQATIDAQNSPKRVVRDTAGKVVGIESAAGSKQVIRDASGKVTGME